MRRQLTAILPLMIAVVATRVLGSTIFHIFDDAFITLRYGKNLIETGAFVYNAGEWVMGTTSPAFGLLASVFYAASLPMPATMLILNICIDVLLTYLIYRLVSESYGELAAVLSALFFAISPSLVRISVGAMEADLFILLALTSLILYHRQSFAMAIMIASLSYFVRPEGALLALYLVGMRVIAREYGSAIKLAACSALTVLPGLVLLHFTYGSFIPQSVAAKAGASLPIIEVFRRLVVPEPSGMLFLVCSAIGIRQLVRTSGVIRSYLAFATLYLVIYLAVHPWTWPWYAMPVQVALVLGAGISISTLIQKISGLRVLAWSRYVPVAGMCVVILFWVGVAELKGSTGIERNIYSSLSSTSQHLQGSSILALDIGAVGYFSNAHIYDGVGLVTPAALEHGSLWDMIVSTEPDALFLNTTKETEGIINTEYFSKRYVFERRYGPSGDSTLPRDTREYINAWQQDYLLFVKRQLQ